MTKIKLMKIALVVAALLIGLTGYSRNVNDYKHAIGVRIASTGNDFNSFGLGLTYKGFTRKHQAFETVLDVNNLFTSGRFNMQLGMTYQFYFTIVKGLRAYVGPGASLGLRFNPASFNLNLDAIVGLEFKFRKAPIAFSLDWNPKLMLIKPKHWGWWSLGNFGLGIKIAF